MEQGIVVNALERVKTQFGERAATIFEVGVAFQTAVLLGSMIDEGAEREAVLSALYQKAMQAVFAGIGASTEEAKSADEEIGLVMQAFMKEFEIEVAH